MQPLLLSLPYAYSSSSSSPSHIFIMLLLWILSSVFVSWLVRVLAIRWWCRRNGRRLPPGSLGWLYIGETLKLYAEDPNSFFSKRQKRYGNIFKSHILGCPCVMVSSPEAARVVLVTRAHMFKPTYPQSKERIIGPSAIFFHQGPYHSRLKRLIQSSLVPSALKRSVSEIEQIVLNFLPAWKDNCTINTLREMKMYAFDVAILTAFGERMGREMEMRIKQLYQRIEKGYNSMPLDIPGTSFHKAMKARKLLNEALRKLIEERRREDDHYEHGGSKQGKGGLLEVLMGATDYNYANDSKGQRVQQFLSDTQIADNIIGVIFAAHDTTASALTWALKYLHDNPKILHAVTMEQEVVKRGMCESGRQGLTWEDTRKMPLTSRVIQETLRAASILSFTFREAVEDVEFEGYFIPKGWKILPLFRTIHHHEDFFPNPDKFDPSRFEVAPRPNAFMPFGNGAHSCPGSELAKLEILVLLHHLTLTYRWEMVGDGDGIQYGPFPVPKQGLPIRVIPRDRDNKSMICM